MGRGTGIVVFQVENILVAVYLGTQYGWGTFFLLSLIDSCAGDERVGLPVLASPEGDKQEVLTGPWAGRSKQTSKKHFC